MQIDTLLARRVRELRKRQGLSLDGLAQLSGVSRSMISLIEREETSPTAAVLNKLADALGVPLVSLFAEEPDDAPASPLNPASLQAVWRDPASGYSRRHLSPGAFPSPLELAEVSFPAGQSVTFDNPLRSMTTHQQLWLMEGEMVIDLDGECWRLHAGDCLAMVLGQRIVFHNPGAVAARYLLALTTVPATRRN